MLEQLNRRLFAEQLHTKFQVSLQGMPPLVLELFEVTEDNSAPKQEQFSLLFRGPKEPVLSQGICPMEHEKIGSLALFIVPIGPDEQGMRYQAVFNRFREPEKQTP